ncbi:MAG TPA: carboxypeptidase-like regulatory domain-containing protein, partial [Pyrinomonadaceae bacterium]|nr:carboxypeptidase-like regulatory domain-containing protein [Pyrinomonadaceae bacterium]
MNKLVQRQSSPARISSRARHQVLVAFIFLLCGPLIFAQSPPTNRLESGPDPKQTKPSDEKPKAPAVSRTGSIKGRVRADDGRVLANATVVARPINGVPGMKAVGVDAEGRFTLDDMPAALYLVFATAPGYIDEQLAIGELDQFPRHLIGSQIN